MIPFVLAALLDAHFCTMMLRILHPLLWLGYFIPCSALRQLCRHISVQKLLQVLSAKPLSLLDYLHVLQGLSSSYSGVYLTSRVFNIVYSSLIIGWTSPCSPFSYPSSGTNGQYLLVRRFDIRSILACTLPFIYRVSIVTL